MRAIESYCHPLFRVVFLVFLAGNPMGSARAQEPDSLQPARVDDGAPSWLKHYDFKTESFTFVRLRYDQPPARWATDFPDADINLSSRLGEVTSLQVAPKGMVLEITDPALREYPFAYLSSNGVWDLTVQQVQSLRQYLHGGGFLMIDDSWGEEEWRNVLLQLKRVLPDREPTRLPLQHPIFHCVFDLQELPQVCGIFYALQGREQGVTWERPDTKQVGYHGIANENGRIVVLICHNTDLADGWERFEADAWYAREFSEKKAFPMGINIVFYALTSSH